jgi:hypothetical protein
MLQTQPDSLFYHTHTQEGRKRSRDLLGGPQQSREAKQSTESSDESPEMKEEPTGDQKRQTRQPATTGS